MCPFVQALTQLPIILSPAKPTTLASNDTSIQLTKDNLDSLVNRMKQINFEDPWLRKKIEQMA